MPLSAGSRLGPYEILARLGAGGMGEVYRARDPKLDREVAIKILPAITAADSMSVVRFEREAKAIAALSHPNILAIHDFGFADGVTYAVMELLKGETLRQRLDRGPIPCKRAVEIAREIALGLAAAHDKGIVHRDLKPENLFLTDGVRAKILDFGLARHYQREPSEGTLSDHTEPGKVVGTTGYMSPEQVRGSPVDHRSDIFSFGSVLYEVLSGHRAFKGDTSVETMHAILHDDPAPLSSSERPVAPALERIVSHCLEKLPSDRFQSARDLAFDLDSLAASSASEIGPAIPAPRLRHGRAALVAAVVAIAAIGAWAGSRFAPARDKLPAPTFRRLTFRRGNLLSARFAPDGKTVVYGAAWEGKPSELFSVRTDSVVSQPLGIEHANVASISSKGDLAILQKAPPFGGSQQTRTLARLPLGGGTPRDLLEDVVEASWSPDGENLAVIRELAGGKRRLEYPIGHVLYEAMFLNRQMRVSPDGGHVAVSESKQGKPTTLWVFDRHGGKRALANFGQRLSGLAWSPDSREVLFVGGPTSESLALRAIDLSGRERVLLPAVGRNLTLHDVAFDGRVLLERSTGRFGMAWRPSGETSEREIGWLDGSEIQDLSDDGRVILFGETRDGGAAGGQGVYIRRADGSPAIRLGDGIPLDLSPDNKWALAMVGQPPEIVMLPIGPGSARRVPTVGITPFAATFAPDGKHVAVIQLGEAEQFKLSLVGFEGGPLQSVPIPGMALAGIAISRDQVAYATATGKIIAVSIADGARRELPGPALGSSDEIVEWSSDGRFLYVAMRELRPIRILRRKVETGVSSPFLNIGAADATGVTDILKIVVTPDGSSYAYTYYRTEGSDLFVVDGLR